MSRSIVFSFDDGPHKDHTPYLLDVLAAHKIKAVFFVIGEKLEHKNGREILERMYAEGHTVGNHTYSHPRLTDSSEQHVFEELSRTHELICSTCGHCRLFRPPYGATNFTVQKVATDLGYFQMLWNVDTFDWKLNNTQNWIRPALEQISFRTHSLVLMHDIHKATVEAVPEFIQAIQEQQELSFIDPETLVTHSV